MGRHPLELDEPAFQFIEEREYDILFKAQRFARETTSDSMAQGYIEDLVRMVHRVKDRGEKMQLLMKQAEAQTQRARQAEMAIAQKYNEDMGFAPKMEKQSWWKRIWKKKT